MLDNWQKTRRQCVWPDAEICLPGDWSDFGHESVREYVWREETSKHPRLRPPCHTRDPIQKVTCGSPTAASVACYTFLNISVPQLYTVLLSTRHGQNEFFGSTEGSEQSLDTQEVGNSLTKYRPLLRICCPTGHFFHVPKDHPKGPNRNDWVVLLFLTFGSEATGLYIPQQFYHVLKVLNWIRSGPPSECTNDWFWKKTFRKKNI